MKYFIATRWANMKSVQMLTENLKSLGHEVFSFVGDERNFVPKENILGKNPFEKVADWKSDENLKNIFEKTLEGISGADVLILLLPAGRSSHLQAGIAYGINKRLVLIGEPEVAEPYYRIFSEWHKNIESYIASLKTNGA